MPRRATRAPRRRHARRGLRKSRVPRSLKPKGFSSKIYTFTFKPASQTLVSSFSPSPTTPPLSLNSASGNASAALRPLSATSTGVSYSPNINLNNSSTNLPSCQDLSFGIDFQIANVENIAKYLQLFDQYRLNWVKVEVENLYPSASIGYAPTGGATVAKPFSDLYMVQDFDSSLPPVSLQSVTGMQGCRMVRFTDIKNKATILIKPRPALSIESNPTTAPLQQVTVAVGKTSQWINSVNSEVNYYALKMWYTNWMNTQSPQQVSALRFTFTYNISFKQPLQAC